MIHRFLVTAAVLMMPGGAEAQQYRRTAPPPPDERIQLSDGRTWERIRLNYVDVRVLTTALGAPNFPTEMDLFRMRMSGSVGGYAAPGMGYGYGGGYAAPAGGYGNGMAMPMGHATFGGRRILGDPNSNSLIVGPRASQGPMGAGGAAPGNNRLFPNLIIFGDPNSNSLIVDP